eukprot:scaffold27_cov125-Skeletonema_dohrnii-CCMP3373.AAC.3
MITSFVLFVIAALSIAAVDVAASSRNLVFPNSEGLFNEIEVWLNKRRSQLDSSVFVSYDKDGNPYPSLWYQFGDFVRALRPIAVLGVGGGESETFFYIGQSDNRGIVHGLVNVAAFLAQASVVSIKYDACDEFNMDKTDYTQKYAVSNSCGQFGRSYQDEVCTGNTAYMTCDVDEDIQMTAVTKLNEEKAPPSLSCRAKDSATDFTGHWDRSTGTLDETFPFSNRMGRIDTAGCCWWGRGVLLTRGTCNFGRINHFLGRDAAAQALMYSLQKQYTAANTPTAQHKIAKGFLNFYDIDFCAFPEVVCRGEDSRNLRWAVGIFEWSDTVQTYRDATSGEEYLDALDKFVQGGFVDVNGFIDLVGEAFPFNCFEVNCKAEESRVRGERRVMFQNILFNVLAVTELVQANPVPTPTPTKSMSMITPDPTPQPTMKPSVRINPPPTPAVVEPAITTPNPTEILSTPNPTIRPIPTIPINARPPTINPTLVATPNGSGLIDLQPGSGATISISWIAVMFGCIFHYIIL